MSYFVCSNCGFPAVTDSRMGSVDHYLVCECVSSKYELPFEGGSRSDTWNDNIFHARPITIEEYHRLHNKNK